MGFNLTNTIKIDNSSFCSVKENGYKLTNRRGGVASMPLFKLCISCVAEMRTI